VIPLRDANPTRRRPVLTIAIIAACFAVFGLELWIQAGGGDDALEAFVRDHGAVPAAISHALSVRDYFSDATLGLVTSMFLHGSWVHVLGNMLYLWIFGNNIEDRFGRVGFAAFYFAGGLIAGLTQVAVDPASQVPLVGASGAIAATLGAYLVLFPAARIESIVFLGFFYQLMRVPAVIVLGFWFVLQLLDGIASLGATTTGGGVAFFAHIGGFAVGGVVAVLVRVLGGRLATRAGPGGVG
jgi:membrane associated rhomboid family serine protease